MSKTVTVVTTGIRTEVMFCPATASILKTVWMAEKQTVNSFEQEPFSAANVTRMNWTAWKVDGTIQISENDSIEFTAETLYDGDEVKLDELTFFTTDDIGVDFGYSDNLFLQELITDKLYSDYNPEMYRTWEEEQEDNHHQLREDEATGN